MRNTHKTTVRHTRTQGLTKMATTHQLLCVFPSEFLTAVPPFKKILRVTLVVPPVRPQLMMVDVCLFLFASLSLLLIHMHPCTRAHMSDSFHGWEVRASAQPTNVPAQTQPHYPMRSREVRSTQPPAQTPPRATRHPQHLTDHDPGGHTSNPWNVPGTCLPIPSERSPPNMGSRPRALTSPSRRRNPRRRTPPR